MERFHGDRSHPIQPGCYTYLRCFSSTIMEGWLYPEPLFVNARILRVLGTAAPPLLTRLIVTLCDTLRLRDRALLPCFPRNDTLDLEILLQVEILTVHLTIMGL